MPRSQSFLAAPLALALAAAAPAPAPAAAEGAGTLTLRVVGVKNATGRVHVDLCPQANFLKSDCPYSASVPAQAPVTVLVVRGLPPGRYAAQLYHDENMNDRLDRGLFGIPKEGFGFSRDAPIRMSPPKWGDAVFAYAGGEAAMQVKMRYWLR